MIFLFRLDHSSIHHSIPPIYPPKTKDIIGIPRGYNKPLNKNKDYPKTSLIPTLVYHIQYLYFTYYHHSSVPYPPLFHIFTSTSLHQYIRHTEWGWIGHTESAPVTYVR